MAPSVDKEVLAAMPEGGLICAMWGTCCTAGSSTLLWKCCCARLRAYCRAAYFFTKSNNDFYLPNGTVTGWTVLWQVGEDWVQWQHTLPFLSHKGTAKSATVKTPITKESLEIWMSHFLGFILSGTFLVHGAKQKLVIYGDLSENCSCWLKQLQRYSLNVAWCEGQEDTFTALSDKRPAGWLGSCNGCLEVPQLPSVAQWNKRA